MSDELAQHTGGDNAAVGLLLVDDEANILSALRRLFRPLGYTIYTATGGAEGLGILEQHPVDLVISDMRMPEMDGAAFLAEVAKRWPEVVRILLTGYADLPSTIAAINQGHIYGYFSKPWEDNEITLTVRHALEQKRLRAERDRLQALTEQQNTELKQLNAELERRVEARTEELRQANMFLELAYKQLKESYFAAIPVFASLLQLREGRDKGHSQRVGALARAIARQMKLDEDLVRQIYFAGLLHDIGKLAWSDTLLNTPANRLDKEQRRIVVRHPAAGQAVLMGMEPLHKTALFIRHHHEYFNGSGYPDQLAGERIPLGARIIAVANDYDGLRSGHLIGDELTAMDACGFLQEYSGERYDADVVEACVAVIYHREHGESMVHELRLQPDHLRVNMILSRDLYSREGVLMLTKGYRLNERLIAKIKQYMSDEEDPVLVHVYAEGESHAPHHAG